MQRWHFRRWFNQHIYAKLLGVVRRCLSFVSTEYFSVQFDGPAVTSKRPRQLQKKFLVAILGTAWLKIHAKSSNFKSQPGINGRENTSLVVLVEYCDETFGKISVPLILLSGTRNKSKMRKVQVQRPSIPLVLWSLMWGSKCCGVAELWRYGKTTRVQSFKGFPQKNENLMKWFSAVAFFDHKFIWCDRSSLVPPVFVKISVFTIKSSKPANVFWSFWETFFIFVVHFSVVTASAVNSDTSFHPVLSGCVTLTCFFFSSFCFYDTDKLVSAEMANDSKFPDQIYLVGFDYKSVYHPAGQKTQPKLCISEFLNWPTTILGNFLTSIVSMKFYHFQRPCLYNYVARALISVLCIKKPKRLMANQFPFGNH